MVSLITRIDTQHRDMIHDAQMDYYGTRLATASSDKSIKVFDVKPGGQHNLSADFKAHDAPVWQVAWSHPMYGSLLASCSYDRKVIIWREVANGQWTHAYEYARHDASVNSISWAPAEFGLMLACASSDGSVSIIFSTGDNTWDAKRITNVHSIGCNAVDWCPSTVPGSLLEPTRQSGIRRRIVTGGCDELVKIWREDEQGQWVEEAKLDGHSDWVRDVAWSPNVGLSDSIIASCSQDQQVIIWRCSDLDSAQWQRTVLHKFDDVIWHVSWSLCGTILAVSGGDNKVSLWKDTLEGQWICISDSHKTGGMADASRG